MVLRPVARLQVKGKTKAVEVRLLAKRDGADDATLACRGLHACFEAYCERRFAEAAAAFADAAALRPDDLPSAHYLAEARRFAEAPPGPEWHGILKLETK
jgi:adenylate cyclase